MDGTDKRQRNDLLNAANRHPNSKVAKLIKEFLTDNSRSTLVLLLEELEKHEEYATDFTICIDFFLKRIEEDLDSENYQFSQLGRKLMAVGRIWAKRVEELYSRTESQSHGLSSNSEQTETPEMETEASNEAAAAAATAKPKSRKRPIQDDKNELKMEVKSFKRVTANKLFADCEDKDNPQMLPHYFAEEHINPTLYKSSFLIDPDNAENVDRKNNYKIFHYHIEHRYNTPVSDYNFRLHFAIKDYMHNEDIDDINNDEIDELVAIDDEHCLPSLAPQQYLEKAFGLENQAFEGQLSVMGSRKRKSDTELEDPIEKQKRFSLDISNINIEPISLKSLPSQDSGIGENTQPLTESILPVEGVNNVVDGILQENQNETIGHDLSFNPENQATNSSEIANESFTNNPENNAAEIMDEGINNSNLPDFNQSNLLESTKLIQDANAPTDLGFGETKVLPDVVMTTDKLSQSDDEGIVLSDHEESSYRQTPTENMEQANQDPNKNDNNVDALINNNNVDMISGPVDNNLNQIICRPLEEDFCIKNPLTLNIFAFKENLVRRKINFKLPLELNKIKQLKSKTVKQKPPNEIKKHKIEDAKVPSQIGKYNRMGAPNAIYSHAQRCSIDDEGNGSESEEGDFIGFDIPTIWSEGILVFPKDSLNDIPQVRDASDVNHNTDIINDQSFIEGGGGETAEQSVLEAEQCMPIGTNNQELIDDHANIDIVSPINEQGLNSYDIVNDPEVLDVPEINLNDSSEIDQDDSQVMETSMETEESDDSLEQHVCESEQNIREWHRNLAPSLAISHQRQQFSVFDIGTKIIDKVSNGADTVEKIVANEEQHDFSKNFLSLLMLTNQGNVALDAGERNSDEPTELSDLKVTLLSKKRHQVHIEDDIGAPNIVAPPPPKRKAFEPNITSTVAASTSISRRTSTIPATATVSTNINVSEIQHMVRTLPPIPKAKNTDDNDSGVGSLVSQDSIS